MQNIPTQPLTTQSINTIPTISQPVNTIPLSTQPMQPVNTMLQPRSTLPLGSQPVLNTPIDPSLQGSDIHPREFLAESEPIRSDFGKIKALAVLTFKEAELERTLEGQTTFTSVGNLEVLYFANYDRFVLSLNDWKYPLLRRIPITASGSNLGGRVQYTLPTYNGFYALRLNKIPHIEALQNLETILSSNSSFSYQGTENILDHGLSLDDRFRGQGEPIGQPVGQPMGQSMGQPMSQPISQPMGQPIDPYLGGVEPMPELQASTSTGHPGLTRGGKIKRGFKMMGYKLTKGLSRKGKHNLNHLQVRDIDSIKRTSEITVPIHLYPRKEVERWITYAKEISSRSGFEPEIGPGGYETGLASPTFYESGRMRGYGSVDLGQGSVSAPFTSRALAMGITSERPLANRLYTSTTGTISGAHHGHVGYTKPNMMDKIKAKLPGTHHYHGEKVEGYTYGTHSTATNPGVLDKVKAKIVGHDPFPHEGLAGPMGIVGTQSVYTHSLPVQGTRVYSGTPIVTSGTPVYTTSAPVYTTTPGTVIRSDVGSTGIPTQVQYLEKSITQTGPTILPGMTQTQGVINDARSRVQNIVGPAPTQYAEVMRSQQHLAHDQA